MSRRSRGSLQLGAVAAADPTGAGGGRSERIEPTGLERLRSGVLLALVVAATGLALAAAVTTMLIVALYLVAGAVSG